MWCLSFKGYIWTFRFHSGFENDEGITSSRTVAQIEPLPPVKLAPTFQVPLVLCEQVRHIHPEQQFLVFLDNLFLNVKVAHCLLAIGFAVMGTTRKNATGIPQVLLGVNDKNRNAKKEKKDQPLAYNSILVVIVAYCLCFLWHQNRPGRRYELHPGLDTMDSAESDWQALHNALKEAWHAIPD